MSSWMSYYRQVGDKPNSLVVQALKDFKRPKTAALDLGAGNLRDSKFLKKSGFKRVTAVDSSHEARAFAVDGIDLRIGSIADFRPDESTYTLASCCNTLFHLNLSEIESVFRNVLLGLRPKGIFLLNVLGDDDDWAIAKSTVVTFSEESLVAMCHGFKIVHAKEHRGGRKINKQFVYGHEFCLMLRKP